MCALRTPDAPAVTANPHLTTETLTAGNPDAAIAAVLFHGRDQDAEWMLDVARRIDLDDVVAYVLPRAAGRSWYPGRFYDPMEDNEPCLGWSLQAIEAAVARAAGRARPRSRIALVGFSQGACILAEHLARRPEPYGAAAILTGALFGTPDLERMPVGSLDGLPMFFGIAEHDDWIPIDAVRDTVAAYQRAGARCELRVYDDEEHGVNDDEAAAVRGLLLSLLRHRRPVADGPHQSAGLDAPRR
jgi:phospholipase/carboxylesterase